VIAFQFPNHAIQAEAAKYHATNIPTYAILAWFVSGPGHEGHRLTAQLVLYLPVGPDRHYISQDTPAAPTFNCR
jgi:hypothetical protein